MTTISDTATVAARKIERVKDPVERARGYRALVEESGSIRSNLGHLYAIAVYEAQRAKCSCGMSWSQPAELRRHLADNPTGHRATQNGCSYTVLAKRMGVNPARVNQLISKGRLLAEGNGDG